MPAAVLLLIVLLLPLSAQEKWPARFQASPPKLKPLPSKENTFAWETSHFILNSEIELPRQRLLEFSQVMESIPQLLQTLPLPLWVPPPGPKAVIRICQNETSFAARGGPPGAAGYYHGRQAIVLLRGDLLLNPPQAQKTNLRLSPDGDLLIHELCHLAMHQYGRLPPWLVEGIAEYFASCHLGKGRYDFTDSPRQIQQHIRKFYPQDRFPNLVLPPISNVAALSSKEWIRNNSLAQPEDRYRLYATSLLLAHYYLEGGTKRRSELSEFLHQKLLNKGTAKQNLLAEIPDDLPQKLTHFWKNKGLTIEFKDLN